MGKNMTKKKKQQRKRAAGYLRAGAIALLTTCGVGIMVFMAMFNGTAKPNRDMQWYIRQGDVEVAAPPMGEGFDGDGAPATTAGGVPYVSAQSIKQPSERVAEAATAQRRQEADVEPQSQPQAAAQTADREQAESAAPEEEYVDMAGAAEVFDELSQEQAGASTADLPASRAAQPEAEPEPEPEEDSGTVTITVTAAGDCTFGGEEGAKGRRRFLQLANEKGLDYFFQNVRHVFENDDLTIVNLEGPLTSSDKPGKHGGFIFKGDPSYVGILTGSSVELCNLANNHTLDYGKTGLKDTARILDEAGVGYCGYSKVYTTTIKGVRVSSLGFTWWDYDAKEITRIVAEARKDCDLLIVNIHWGWEGNNQQDYKQVKLGHAIIDAGADLLIGTHPHVYQGIEKYKGKYIVYSLGNFCFAGNANPADKRCLIFQQKFSFNPGMGIAQANISNMGINVIPCTVSSVRNLNDFQPTIMPAKEGASLLKAVASRSTSFDAENTLWMKDNYLVAYGLIGDKDEQPVTTDLGSGTGDAEAPAADGSVT